MTFDPTKPVRTRSGLKVRILCTDFHDGEYCIVAIIYHKIGKETVKAFTANGYFLAEGPGHSFDLVNVPDTRSVWINVNPSTHFCYPTREIADRESAPFRLGLIEVTYAGEEIESCLFHKVK